MRGPDQMPNVEPQHGRPRQEHAEKGVRLPWCSETLASAYNPCPHIDHEQRQVRGQPTRKASQGAHRDPGAAAEREERRPAPLQRTSQAKMINGRMTAVSLERMASAYNTQRGHQVSSRARGLSPLLEVTEVGGEQEYREQGFGDAGDPGDGLGMGGMQTENQGGEERGKAVLQQAYRREVDQQRYPHMAKDGAKVPSPRIQSESQVLQPEPEQKNRAGRRCRERPDARMPKRPQ